MPPALRHASHLEKLGSNLTPTRGLEYTKDISVNSLKESGLPTQIYKKIVYSPRQATTITSPLKLYVYALTAQGPVRLAPGARFLTAPCASRSP